MVRHILRQKGCVGGAFKFAIEDVDRSLSYYGRLLIQLFTNWRAKYLQLPYGDQCLFVKKETFLSLGGFPALDFMEDFEFVKRLQRKGKLLIAPVAAVTSGRRWKKLGLFKTTVTNQVIITAYAFGVSPTTLLLWYYGNK